MTVLQSSGLSKRSQDRFLNRPRLAYVAAHVEATLNLYDENLNPTGAIPLAIAENKLMVDVLLNKLRESNEHSSSIFNYTFPSGLPDVRQAVADFLSSRLFCSHTVDSDNIVLGPGCTGLNHELSMLLFDEGDGILIPTPYYPAFDRHFYSIGGIKTIPVHNTDVGLNDYARLQRLSLQSLNEAYAKATVSGPRPRALLLTNPGNPSGGVYTAEELSNAVRWCRERSLHLICDEVYALSILTPDIDGGGRTFISMVEVLGGDLRDDVHILWSFSKDLGSSGLRLGVFYSKNKLLLQAMGACNDMCTVSNLMQSAASQILQDSSFLDGYFLENSARLRTSYDIVRVGLNEAGIPFLSAVAGIFVLVDLRSLLRQGVTFEAEEALETELATRGVVLTPGRVCHCPQPGFFRLCYAFVRPEALKAAIRRIARLALDIQGSCTVA